MLACSPAVLAWKLRGQSRQHPSLRAHTFSLTTPLPTATPFLTLHFRVVDRAAHIRPLKKLPQNLGVSLATAIGCITALLLLGNRLRPHTRTGRQVSTAAAVCAAAAPRAAAAPAAGPPLALVHLLRTGLRPAGVVVSVASMPLLPIPLCYLCLRLLLIRQDVGAQSGKQAGCLCAVCSRRAGGSSGKVNGGAPGGGGLQLAPQPGRSGTWEVAPQAPQASLSVPCTTMHSPPGGKHWPPRPLPAPSHPPAY